MDRLVTTSLIIVYGSKFHRHVLNDVAKLPKQIARKMQLSILHLKKLILVLGMHNKLRNKYSAGDMIGLDIRFLPHAYATTNPSVIRSFLSLYNPVPFSE